jgi:hypothetical protein
MGWISTQSYPFNLKVCGAAMNSVNSDNKLADACVRAVRPCVVLRTALSHPAAKGVRP